jgi:hypothetical protein
MRSVCLACMVVALVGCDRAQPVHTHLWIDSPKQHVWTYQPVASVSSRAGETNGGFLKKRLLSGDAVTLSNGVTVSFDGSAIRIRDTALPTNMLNCVIDRDGSILTNAFIRTSD